ncbi:MAG: TonB-dependent receptor [Candidatus Krumholzibacteriia bacterium]
MRALVAVVAMVTTTWTLAVGDGGAGAGATATAPRDTVYAAPEIVVEAPRIAPAIDDVFRRPGFVAVLDVSEREDRVEDMATMLSRMIGIRVRQYGGLGSFATVSIRGSSANQVEVFLDGVPLNDAYLGVTNLGDLPLGGISRIEVFRGFSPPHLGASAVGGAVNLVTTDDAKWASESLLSRVEARESYGSFGTERHVLSLWSRHRELKLFLHGNYVKSRGDFEFVDDQTTPLNPDDDETVTRQNNGFHSWDFLGRMQATVPRVGKLILSQSALVREQGVPGVGSFQSQTANSQRSRYITNVQLATPSLSRRHVRVFTSGFYSTTRERFHDPDAEVSFLPQETDNTFRSFGGGGRVRLDAPLVPASLEVFHQSTRERFRPGSQIPSPTEGPDRNRTTHTTAVSTDVFVHPLGLVLTASARYESQTTEFYDPPLFPWLPPTPQGRVTRSEHSPRYGLRWLATPNLTVKANWGRYFRRPTILELFGNTGSVTGSAGLEPEVGLNRDAGFVLSLEKPWWLERLFLETVYVDNRVDNLILFFPNSQLTSRPENISASRTRGWEFSFSALIDRFHVAGNYTRMDSEDTGPIPFYRGNELPGRPANESALFVDYAAGRWKLSYELHRIGKNFLDPANRQTVPAREIHNAAMRLSPLGGALSLTVEGRNLADRRIGDVNGFPLPGRSFFATLTYKP